MSNPAVISQNTYNTVYRLVEALYNLNSLGSSEEEKDIYTEFSIAHVLDDEGASFTKLTFDSKQERYVSEVKYVNGSCVDANISAILNFKNRYEYFTVLDMHKEVVYWVLQDVKTDDTARIEIHVAPAGSNCLVATIVAIDAGKHEPVMQYQLKFEFSGW